MYAMLAWQCLHGNACWTCRVAFWQWILVHAGTWEFYAWSASPQLERLSRRQGPQGLDDVSYTLQLSSHSIISANVVRWPSFSIDTKWSLIIFLLRQKNDNLALFLDYAWYELKELNQWASDSITAQIIGGRWFEWDFYLDFLKNFRENDTVPEDEQFRPQWVARAGDSEDRRRRHRNRTYLERRIYRDTCHVCAVCGAGMCHDLSFWTAWVFLIPLFCVCCAGSANRRRGPS